MEKSENKMGTRPIGQLIVSMSSPAMFSMLILALYNIVDSMFVAQYSHDALTAVNLAYPMQMLMISVSVGTGVGINSLISRMLGQKNQDAANRAAAHGMILSCVSWALFAVIGLFFSRAFFMSFTSDETVISLGIAYMTIVTVFSFGSFFQVAIEKTLQATGNMVVPMVIQLIGAITNLILDPIMIFGLFGFPELGITGAAIATVIGQIIAMAVGVIILIVRPQLVSISFRKFHFNWGTIRSIYAVGAPAILMQAIGSFLITILNYILIEFSDAAVNVLGVYYKLQTFVFMPVFGLNQGILPIIGYNYGAGKKKRMFKALNIGYIIAICIMAIGTLLFVIFPENLLQLFNADEEMLDFGVTGFRIISISFFPAAIGILSVTLFQAIGQGVKSLMISFLRQIIIILPVAYFLSKVIGVYGIWWSFPIAEVIALVFCIVMVIQVKKSLDATM